jgi:hypothetical protein
MQESKVKGEAEDTGVSFANDWRVKIRSEHEEMNIEEFGNMEKQ